jgi:hypothetical protein
VAIPDTAVLGIAQARRQQLANEPLTHGGGATQASFCRLPLAGGGFCTCGAELLEGNRGGVQTLASS